MKVILKLIKLLLSFILSYILFFYVTSDFISYFFQGSFRFEQILYIIVFLIQTVLISFLLTHSHVSDITPLQVKLIWILYAFVMLILLFGRAYIDYSVNLNISALFDFNLYSFFQNLFNFIFFIPLGFLFKRDGNWFQIVVKAILFVLLIECIQFITHRGIFDIVDIVLDSLGIITGYTLSTFIPKKFKLNLF